MCLKLSPDQIVFKSPFDFHLLQFSKSIIYLLLPSPLLTFALLHPPVYHISNIQFSKMKQCGWYQRKGRFTVEVKRHLVVPWVHYTDVITNLSWVNEWWILTPLALTYNFSGGHERHGYYKVGMHII